MKKILLIILKGVGILLLTILVLTGITVFSGLNYSTHSLKVDKSEFPDVKTDADIDLLSEKLVSEMTLREKIDQMYGEKGFKVYSKFGANYLIKRRFPHIYSGINKDLNIPPWVLSDGPRGSVVRHKKTDAVTTFPVAMARGASWDTDLERRINDVTAIEMRANETNYAATPCINLLRHPAWGRAQETYGEDPWLLGEFGVAAVKALQKHSVMACPKHYALNSIENSRFIVDVELDERTLREVYLPHFKKTIQEGKPASIMSAYNQVRGAYCGSNKELLTDILRDDWGFEGFVSTDWFMGLYDGVEGVKAGLNVEMPIQKAYSYKTLEAGIESGEISEVDIDELVIGTLKTRLKYAFAEDEMEYSRSIIAQASHTNLAREVAEKSMVLIKNENVLPFDKSANKKIAVIGRLADMENTGDHGSSNAVPVYVITPYQGIKNYHETLGNEVNLNDGTDLQSAIDLAKDADEVILVVGYTYLDEGEYMTASRENMELSAKEHKLVGEKGMGGDRHSMKLNAGDEELITALAGVNENLVVTYVGGSAIDMNTWEESVPAILFSWYSGMEGGTALANILYGDVNPSGKLPFSIAKDVNDYPYFNPYIDTAHYDYYHGYTLFDKQDIEAAYPFGFGLSYTQYEYSDLQLLSDEIGANDKVSISVNLTNTGEVSGEEVVQLYIGFKNSAVDRPVKLLRAFDKIDVQSGETKMITMEVAAEDLAWYNPENKRWEVELMEYEIYIGGSSEEEDLLTGSFKIN